MKDVFVCAVLFAAMCFGFWVNFNVSDADMEELTLKIDKISEDVLNGDDEKITAEFEKTQNLWDKKSRIMKILYHHDVTDEIDEAIFKAKFYVDEKNYEKALIKLSEAEYFMQNLKNREKLTLDNIF